MPEQKNTPPQNTFRVVKWADLPDTKSKGRYLVENEGQEPFEIVVCKNRRRTLEGLMRSPIFCASQTRIGHEVSQLRHVHEAAIETLNFKSDSPNSQGFGVYVLRSKVTRLDMLEGAA